MQSSTFELWFRYATNIAACCVHHLVGGGVGDINRGVRAGLRVQWPLAVLLLLGAAPVRADVDLLDEAIARDPRPSMNWSHGLAPTVGGTLTTQSARLDVAAPAGDMLTCRSGSDGIWDLQVSYAVTGLGSFDTDSDGNADTRVSLASPPEFTANGLESSIEFSDIAGNSAGSPPRTSGRRVVEQWTLRFGPGLGVRAGDIVTADWIGGNSASEVWESTALEWQDADGNPFTLRYDPTDMAFSGYNSVNGAPIGSTGVLAADQKSTVTVPLPGVATTPGTAGSLDDLTSVSAELPVTLGLQPFQRLGGVRITRVLENIRHDANGTTAEAIRLPALGVSHCTAVAVPEPTGWWLCAPALGTLAALRRRRTR